MITVVCCKTNQAIYNAGLGKGLKIQNVKFEYIEPPTDKRLTVAYNSILPRLKTDVVAFLHQDLLLLEPSWLRRAEKYCKTVPKLGVAGVAGISWDGIPTGWIIDKVGSSKKPRKKYYGKLYGTYKKMFGSPFKEPKLVQTIDSMAVIMPTDVFKRVQFDKNLICLLATDICLSVKYKLNLDTYVLPLATWHCPIGFNKQKTKKDGKSLVPVGSSKAYIPFNLREVLVKGERKKIKEKWQGKFKSVRATVGKLI